MDSRIQRVIDELTGNEALLGMLDSDAANQMLDWGIQMAESIIGEQNGRHDDAALESRLKALRQVMRSAGNWAAGQYVEPASRVQLRERLLESFKLIFGDGTLLPTAAEVDDLLSLVDDKSLTPSQLISKLRKMLEQHSQGDSHAKTA